MRAGALDLVAFLDLGGFTEQHGADLILFEVHGQARNAVGEGEQFASHDLVQAMNAGDAVANGDHGSNFIDGDLAFVVLDLLTNELGNLVCFNLGHFCSQLPAASDRRPGTLIVTTETVGAPAGGASARKLAFDQLLANALQLAAHRAVINCAAHPNRDAADQLRIGGIARQDGLARVPHPGAQVAASQAEPSPRPEGERFSGRAGPSAVD